MTLEKRKSIETQTSFRSQAFTPDPFLKKVILQPEESLGVECNELDQVIGFDGYKSIAKEWGIEIGCMIKLVNGYEWDLKIFDELKYEVREVIFDCLPSLPFQTLTFSPNEPLGLQYDIETGEIVGRMRGNTQANRFGVQLGWVMTSVNEMGWSDERFVALENQIRHVTFDCTDCIVPFCQACGMLFPVVMRAPCGDDFCPLCIEKSTMKKCPTCQSSLPSALLEYETLLYNNIPKKLIDLELRKKLQHVLPWICAIGNFDFVKTCIEHPDLMLNPHQLGFLSYFPMHLSTSVEISKYLLEKGARINEPIPKTGITPFYMSCKEGNLDLVKFLIKNGAKINCKTNMGMTPLLISAEFGHLDIVKYLILEKKVNINEMNFQGKNALIISILQNENEIVKFILQQKPNVVDAVTYFQRKGLQRSIKLLFDLEKQAMKELKHQTTTQDPQERETLRQSLVEVKEYF